MTGRPPPSRAGAFSLCHDEPAARLPPQRLRPRADEHRPPYDEVAGAPASELAPVDDAGDGPPYAGLRRAGAATRKKDLKYILTTTVNFIRNSERLHMGIFDLLFGPSPEQRAAQEAERKRQEAERKKLEEKRAAEAEAARFEHSWAALERKYENKVAITAAAESSTKRRGHEQELVFDLDGVTAYMAISKIDLGYVPDISVYVGKPLTFRIISMSKYEKSVQVSASIILQEKRQEEERIRREQERKQREEAQARYRRDLVRLASKDYLEGTVLSIQDRGITVRLKDTCDGKEVQCWIHISKLANKFVSHPSEVVKVGDAIKACASLRPSGDELELSIREFEEKEDARRREEVFSRLEKDAIVSGTVKNVLPNAVFVDLGGVDARIHVSELSNGFVSDPNEIVRVGDPVEAAVLRVNEENGRIELSIKRLRQMRLQESRDAKEYQNVNNTGLSYEGPLCLRLNENRDGIEERLNCLAESMRNLERTFPDIAAIPSSNKLETILRSTFPDGMKSRIFIRNLTFEGASGNDNKVLALRPELTAGCYLSSILKPGCSLIFKGRVRGKEFVVDSIYDTTDTEQLEYEASCVATVFRDPKNVGANNFLYDALEETASITKHTSARLDEWEAYLRWKKSLAEQQIAGCKYYDVSYDEGRGYLVFELVSESKEAFQAFRKHLRSRDILAFGDSYSTEKWFFEFNENDGRRGRRTRGVPLGRFEGVLAQGYLDDLPNGYAVPLSAEDEASIRGTFDVPYMARVAYSLSDDDADEVAELDAEPKEEARYIIENLLSKYHNQGFLALSAAGQFALINRFAKAIEGLRNDQSKSPNLALWLFDATRARLPKPGFAMEVDEWLNPGIASNPNQKAAVQKMLDAPDLCLVQGPPGTGKTTVIAEAIYQLAKRGNRVLIASQSNDAVDNALDRLAENPQIRAIRLGQKSRRKSHLDGTPPHKYSEDEALRSYYSSLSSSLSSAWLDSWDSLDAKAVEFETDIRDATYYREDLATLRQRRSALAERLVELREDARRYDAQFEEAQEARDAIVQEHRQASQFAELVSHPDLGNLYLSERQLESSMPVLASCLNSAVKSGLLVVPSIVSPSTQSSRALNGFIEIAFSSAAIIRGVPNKLRSSSGAQTDGEVQVLERKLKDATARMTEAIDDDDEDAVAKWRSERKAIKLELDKRKSGGSAVSLDAREKSLLDERLLASIEGGGGEEVASSIESFLRGWDEAVGQVRSILEKGFEEGKSDDPQAILEQIKSTKGLIESTEDKIKACEEEISQKSRTLVSLSEKYSTSTADADAIIDELRAQQEAHQARLDAQSAMRSIWEPVIRGFRDRLDNSETADYDNDYFKRVYINACNVVGISCTDNMRNLDEAGFDAFDVVIVDEVSKATPPELLIPLMKARKAILVGDHRQLPPMFDEHEKSYSELINDPESIPEDVRDLMTGENFARFRSMVTSSLFKEYFEAADESIKHSLLVQYRMHSDIMDIINRFYDGRLQAGLSAEQENRLKSHGLAFRGIDGGSFITKDSHAYWIDSSSLPDGTPIYESFPGRSTSACNYLEIAAIIELLKRMAEEYKRAGYGKGKRKSIGVISFYQSQVNELRRRLKAAKKVFDFSAIDVDINTVDRFQGKEKNIIIASLVRNNARARASKHVVAFERINVAFSRAQEMLVIVGAKHMYEGLKVELPNMDTGEIRKVPVYRYILEDLLSKGCVRSTSQLIGDEAARQVLADYERNKVKNEAR